MIDLKAIEDFARTHHHTEQFRAPMDFLSNFFVVDGKTAEHVYQAMKTKIPEEREMVLACKTPGQAKRAGRKVTLRPDWNEKRLDIMAAVLRWKFSFPELRQALLATGDLILIEHNVWHDNFWGSCTCPKCKDRGQNHLGRLLMQLRGEIS